MSPTVDTVNEDASGGRYYEWDDGTEYPSVTTILKADPEKKQSLKDWRERHPNPTEYRDRQGQMGRLVHRRVLNQYAIRSLPPEPVESDLVDEDFLADVETAVAMWDKCRLDIGADPHVEVAVKNDTHGYAGRFDLLTEDGVLCDLKISKQVWDSYRFQIAAYWKALEQMDDYPNPRKAAVIRLHPNHKLNRSLVPKVEMITPRQIDNLFDDFTRIMRIYNGEV